MKNVERVGDTNIVGLHTANHNERGNPHPQYVRRYTDGLKTDIGILGGWNVGDGSFAGGYRRDGDFIDVWFKYVMPSTSQSASNFGINIPIDIPSPGLGMYVGSGVWLSPSRATRKPLTILFSGGTGYYAYKPDGDLVVPTTGVDDYLEGAQISGLIRVRT